MPVDILLRMAFNSGYEAGAENGSRSFVKMFLIGGLSRQEKQLSTSGRSERIKNLLAYPLRESTPSGVSSA